MSAIWTVGHSNKNLEQFLSLLLSQHIQAVADVRRFPVSRRHPHFDMESLRNSLPTKGIQYQHFPELGGRRSPRPDSINTQWKNDAFRGYADYMETDDFRKALGRLMPLASSMRTAVMCAEALWWQCHRSLLADCLKASGVAVKHIFWSGKLEDHPYTSPARIVAGRLSYAEESLFDPPANSASRR